MVCGIAGKLMHQQGLSDSSVGPEWLQHVMLKLTAAALNLLEDEEEKVLFVVSIQGLFSAT